MSQSIQNPEHGMQVNGARVFRGSNLFASLARIRIEIILRSLEEYPADQLSGIVDALLAHLVSLEKYICGNSVSDGSVRHMREDTWLGHVAEHQFASVGAFAQTNGAFTGTANSRRRAAAAAHPVRESCSTTGS